MQSPYFKCETNEFACSDFHISKSNGCSPCLMSKFYSLCSTQLLWRTLQGLVSQSSLFIFILLGEEKWMLNHLYLHPICIFSPDLSPELQAHLSTWLVVFIWDLQEADWIRYARAFLQSETGRRWTGRQQCGSDVTEGGKKEGAFVGGRPWLQHCSRKRSARR